MKEFLSFLRFLLSKTLVFTALSMSLLFFIVGIYLLFLSSTIYMIVMSCLIADCSLLIFSTVWYSAVGDFKEQQEQSESID